VGRPVVLSNGQLFVGLDESGLVHDFYYPYVGLENLTNARRSQHRVGLWVDGKFSWTDDGNWDISLNFEDDALVSNIQLRSQRLAITLHLQDFIDPENNALIRHITLTNDGDKKCEIRLFMHQVFQISREGRADTALYVPDEHYLLDYKGRYSLVIGGKFADGNESFDQYAVGNYGIEDKAGTFVDAEDGELSNNPVEHGGVDSVIRFRSEIEAHQSRIVDYWIIAASSQSDAQDLHVAYKQGDMESRLRGARQYWQQWLGNDLELPDFHKRSLQHSLLIIKAHCDARGSVLASGDSSIFNYGRDYYCYCWPRDAAYALWPFIRLGQFDEAKAFFEFARDTRHTDGYLMHKYQPDRAIGSTWHPLIHNRHKELAIQEDETAGVVFMIGEYFEASQDKTFVENLYQSFVVPATDFMCKYVDDATGLPHASYDLWEEKFLTSTYTVSIVIAALQTAAKLSRALEMPEDTVRWLKAAESIRGNLDKLYHQDGYFIKGFLLQENGELAYDNTLDISSLYGPYMFAGLKLEDERLSSTAKHVEERLLNSSPSGGVIRYEHDSYFLSKQDYKGNPWIVCTLWLAQYYSGMGRIEEAGKLLEWALQRELPSGVLSEQFDPVTAEPLGVTPLVWSHAEVVNTVLDLGKDYHEKADS
jgi:GH15 family glucan-1,4-alpha-glucosidase